MRRITLKEALSEFDCTYEDVIEKPQIIEEVPSVDNNTIQQLQNIAKEISQMNIAPNIKNALLAEIQAATASETLQINTTQIDFNEFGKIAANNLSLRPEKVVLLDETYRCTDRTTMYKILLDSRSRYMQYFKDVFDCDNFAEYNSTYAAVNFKLNSVGQCDVQLIGWVGYQFKILGLHACNAPVFSDKTLSIYEGELGLLLPNRILTLYKDGQYINILYIPLKVTYY